MRTYSFSLQGRRPSNEDKHYYNTNINNDNNTFAPVNFFGVFDGHGGKLVSNFIYKKLPRYFMDKKFKNLKNLSTKETKFIINKIFDKVQEKLVENHPIASNRCGSTACCGLNYRNSNNENILWIMNTGDSRSILCNHQNKAIQLSFDHKPNTKIEKTRINNLQGNDKIYFDGSDYRIVGLSVSRSFGDLDSKPYLTHKPEIYKYKLNKNDKFIVFGCDGLWDVCTNMNVVNYINKLSQNNFKGNYAKSLAEYAYKKGSYDNISCIVHFF